MRLPLKKTDSYLKPCAFYKGMLKQCISCTDVTFDSVPNARKWYISVKPKGP